MASMTNRDAQEILVRMGFYGKPRKGETLAGQIAREADNDPQGKTHTALENAIAAVRADSAANLKEAINTLRAFYKEPALDFSQLSNGPAAPTPTPVQPAPATGGRVLPPLPAAAAAQAGPVRYHDGKFVVRGDSKTYWDTISTIAAGQVAASLKAGEPLFDSATGAPLKTVKEVAASLIRNNGIKTVDGRDCNGDITIAYIKPKQELIMPKGPQITNLDVVLAINCGQNPTPGVSVPPAPSKGRPPVANVTDLTERVALPEYPPLGGVDHSKIYTAANMRMLLGRMPEQPEIAARGHNPHTIRVQTARDVVESVLDPVIPIATVFIQGALVPASPVVFLPLHMGSGRDSAQRAVSAQQGSNGQYGNADVPDGSPLLNVRKQWLFNGSINPISPGEIERRDSTLLPGQAVELTGQGQLVTAAGTQYTQNQFYAVNGGGDPAVTISHRKATTGENNTVDWGRPSAPQVLYGTSNYAMASDANTLSIEPQLLAANKAFDANPNRENAQRVIGLLNYQSTLVGVKQYPVNPQNLHPTTPEQVMALNRAERVAYNRERFVAHAEAVGVRGLDRNYLPAETPVRTIPKAELREKMIGYYAEFARENPNAFERLYAEPENVGKANQRNLNDAGQRRAAAAEYVDHMPLMRTYPTNGAPMEWVDRFISNRDPMRPTEVARDNFNRFERGEFRPQAPATDPAVMTQAMHMISDDAGMTSLVLASASYNRKVAETIAYRDRYSIDMPREMGDHTFRFSRESAQREVAERGYNEAAMQTTFGIGAGQGILRGDVDGAGRMISMTAINGGRLPENGIDAAQRDIAATAVNSQAIRLRQADFKNLATDGSPDIAAFPVGSLQTNLLYALATERGTKEGNETLSRIEARIRNNYPEAEVPGRIEMFRQALDVAANTRSVAITGASLNAIAATQAMQTVLSATPAGTGLLTPNSIPPAAGAGVTVTQDQAIASYAAVAKNGPQSQRLVGQLATTKSPVAEEVLGTVAGNENINRPQVARLALTNVNSNAAARGIVMTGLASDAERDRFSRLNPAKLSADDASFVLNAVNKPVVREAVFGAIERDATASRAVAQTISQYPVVGQHVTAELGAPAAATVAAGRPAAAPAARPATQFTNAGPLGQSFVAAAAGGTAGVVREAFINRNTSSTMITSLTQNDVGLGYASTVAAQTLAAKPELLPRFKKDMREAGGRSDSSLGSKMFNDNLQTDLSIIIEHLSEAQRTGNKEAAQRHQAELVAFASAADPATPDGVKHLRALKDLVAAVTATPAGLQTFAGIAGNVMTLPAGPATTPAQRLLVEAAIKADPANAGVMAAIGGRIIDGLPSQPGWTPAGIPVPNPLYSPPKHSQQPPTPQPKPPTPTPQPPTPVPVPPTPVPVPPTPVPTPVPTPLTPTPVPGCGILPCPTVLPPVPVVPTPTVVVLPPPPTPVVPTPVIIVR